MGFFTRNPADKNFDDIMKRISLAYNNASEADAIHAIDDFILHCNQQRLNAKERTSLIGNEQVEITGLFGKHRSFHPVVEVADPNSTRFVSPAQRATILKVFLQAGIQLENIEIVQSVSNARYASPSVKERLIDVMARDFPKQSFLSPFAVYVTHMAEYGGRDVAMRNLEVTGVDKLLVTDVQKAALGNLYKELPVTPVPGSRFVRQPPAVAFLQ